MSRRHEMSIVAVVVLAAIAAGCSPATTGIGSTSQSLPSSPAVETSSSTPGAVSTTVPATTAPAGSTQVKLAGPPPHFEPADLIASAGDIVFFLENTSPGFHSLAIGSVLRESLAASATISPGQAAAFTVQGVPAGQYIIWRTISDHAALGMVGTLTVGP